LQNKESLVLPYFGGAYIDERDRRFRLSGELEPGWWRFRIEGRRASCEEPAEPLDISALPAVRGHFAAGWLFSSGAMPERIALIPEEEPPALSPVVAHRWYSGDLVFGAIGFEDDAEQAARRALEEQQAIAEVKGIGASLRAAFGYALARAVARELDVPVSPLEVRSGVLAIAAEGRPAVDRLLKPLVAQRREYVLLAEARRAAARAERHRREHRPTRQNAEERAREALDAAGARLLDCRNLDHSSLEVTFAFCGERFISVVDQLTLQVYDAGICLDGTDRLLTLDSLPSVIREAIATGQLNITRT
jgi:hypothetical protein